MKAVICGYYGKGNGGDEALLVSLLQLLPREVTPIVLSANPQQTFQAYSVESCDRNSLIAVFKALRRSNIFIWGGGSLMQDATSFISPFYYGGLMALAQLLGLKTIAWAQGIGPLNHPIPRWFTKKVLQNCTAVSVRDYPSAQLLASWQISAIIAPDPVWALQSKSVQGLGDLPAPRIAFNLRSHPQLTPSRLAILTQALIDFQKATKACILLVPFQASQDLDIARSIASQLLGEYRIVYLENPRELKGLFREVKMTIGMRLHSLIMAAAEECLCFALSYDPKVSRLMEETNISGWKLRELPEDSNIISKAWLDHYFHGKALSKEQIQSLVNRALMHQEILK